jgi:hypothetical protein
MSRKRKLYTCFGVLVAILLTSGAWAQNKNRADIAILRASDGLNLGTFPTGGRTPNQMVFDGDNIWVTDEFEDTFVKLRPSDGAQVFFFRGGLNGPSGIAFDGTSVWVSNFGDLTASKF